MRSTIKRSMAPVLLLLLAALPGCGRDRLKTVPVSGTVTFNGGSMPGPGVICFTVISKAAGHTEHPVMAKFDKDGRYQAVTLRENGLVPGRYGVAIYCVQATATMDQPNPPSLIPERYQNATTSGLELDVPPDSRGLTFDLPLTDRAP